MDTSHKRKKAFTLTELLVVVIVIGVLSAVVLPKFSKVVETRKTTEAEELMSAVRTEQEKRCALDKNYLTDLAKMSEIIPDTDTKNFTYTATTTGIKAQSKGKYNYTLEMPSYRDGRLCCESAEECAKLNKDYPLCSSLIVRADYQSGAECAGVATPMPPVPVDPCDTDPNQPACCFAPNVWVTASNQCEPKAVCTEEQTYDEATNTCMSHTSPTPPTPSCTSSTWASRSGTDAPEDTCPGGNTSSAYVCDGSFTGSCTDIRNKKASISVSTTAQDRRDPITVISGTIPVDTCDGDQVSAFTCQESEREYGERTCTDVVTGTLEASAIAHATGYFITASPQNGSCPGDCPSGASSCTFAAMQQMTSGPGGMEFNPDDYSIISHCRLPGTLENGACKYDFLSCGYPKNLLVPVFEVYCYGTSDTAQTYSWEEHTACCN